MRYQPDHDPRCLSRLTIRWTDDDHELAGANGWFYRDRAEIVVDKRLHSIDRRCTLAHEFAHALRGDEPCGEAVLDQRQEEAADRMAARILIPLPLLVDATRWTAHHNEAAELLRVTNEVLETRIRGLHPAEKGLLDRIAHLRGGTA